MGGTKYPTATIPHYSKYKWQDIPQLVKHQERLAERGLYDPWARNHVWKFMNPVTKNQQLPWYMFWSVNYPAQRGFTLGLIAIGIFVGLDKIIGFTDKKDSGHH